MEEDDNDSALKASIVVNALQTLGRGFDLTCDIRIIYCKGTERSRLIEIDEEHTKTLEVPGGISIPNVSRDIKCVQGTEEHFSTGVLDFEQMAGYFNEVLSLSGKTASGVFNTVFSFSGSWHTDALATKGLAVDGWSIILYTLSLTRVPLTLIHEVKVAAPYTWDPTVLASFIERYGTHIVTSVSIGGKDVIYVKQHQSSTLTPTDVELHLKELRSVRFSPFGGHISFMMNEKVADQMLFSTQQIRPQPYNSDCSSSFTGKEDITVIYRRRGGNDLVKGHDEWKKTVPTNPDVVTMTFIPITSLLEDGPCKDHLNRAILVYLEYKPPIEELQYFLAFHVARVWAPVQNELGPRRREPVCPALQFSLMGIKLYISTTQVSVGRRPVTGLRLSLEGKNFNRLAVHVQHLNSLPKVLLPHWDAYIAIGALKWHGPEEQDSRWFEPVLWRSFSHISTAPVEFSETWVGDASGAFIVTGAQLGVWDFGLKSVLYLRLLYSKVPGCTIRRSVWDHTPVPLSQHLKVKTSSKTSVSTATSETPKLLKFVDTTEMSRGPQDMPGHWMVTGAKLGVEKSKIFLRVKYSLLNY